MYIRVVNIKITVPQKIRLTTCSFFVLPKSVIAFTFNVFPHLTQIQDIPTQESLMVYQDGHL